MAGPRAESRGMVDLHMLPPVTAINGARIRELTGDATIAIPDTTQIMLQAFRAVVGERTFYVGYCLGDETGFGAIGIAVIDRLTMVAPGAALHVVLVVHDDIAWDIVLRHLRNFTGQVLLFAFPNSDVYDAGTAEMYYSKAIRLFDDMEDTPWIFNLATPAGKMIRTAVWNGRRNYAHELPEDIVRWVGGEKIAIVQVEKPVGVNLRSSLSLTHFLAKDFDGVIHWARDTETFQSILKSFIRLDLESISPPDLPEGWKPEVTILAANSAPNEER